MTRKHLYTLLLISGITLPSYSANSIIAHWSFDSTLNQTYYDVSGNGFDAALNKGSASVISGLKGNSLNCTNDSFLVTIKNSAVAFNVPQFTVEGWIYSSVSLVNPGSAFNSHLIFTTQTWIPSGKAEGFEISVDDQGKFHLAMANPSGDDWIYCTSDSSLKPGNWYHVAGTYDNQIMKVYINGRLAGKYISPGSYNASHSNAVIGCQISADSSQWRNWFKGKIDELKFYNYALDSSSIARNYSELNPYQTDRKLLAHWSFDSYSQGTFQDMTGNGFGAITNLKSADGVLGKALLCDSSAFDVEIKNSVEHFNVTQLTIEGWINSEINLANPGSFNNYKKIFVNDRMGMEGSGDAGGFALQITDKGKLDFSIANPGKSPSWIILLSDSTLHPRQWYHVAATYDGSVMRLFINGQLVKEMPHSTGLIPTNIPARIGCELQLTSASTSRIRTRFVGKIDELKLYNYALDTQSIQTIYKQLKPADEPAFEINLGMKTTYAQPGDTVIMPVYITNFEDFSISACQFSMKYNSSIVELLSVTKDSGIIKAWPLFNWNPLSIDSASIAIAGTDTSFAYGEGELVRCIFRVKPSAGNNDTCTISLNNISIDETYHLVTATGKAGKIIITNKSLLYGDVTGNGEVNIFDAQKVMSFVVGALVLPDSICCPNFTVAVADVSGNGKVTCYDAALIFQHSIGLLPEFPVTQTTVKKVLQKKTIITLPIAHLTTHIENGSSSELKCTVIGSNLKGFVAGEFSFEYDPSVIALTRGSITTSVRGATLNSRIDQTNKLLKVAIVTNDDIDENDPIPLISITLPPAQGNTDKAFTIRSASINEGKIPTNFSSTSIQQGLKGLHSDANSNFKLIIRGNNLIFNSFDYINTTEITIWTLNGKSILSKKLICNSASASLTIDRLPPGSYIYKVKNNKVISKGKFVITY